MNQLIVIAIGLLMGGLARQVLLRHAPGGLPMALLLGTAGAMFATFLGHQFGVERVHDMVPRISLPALGAAVLLLGYRLDLSRLSNSNHGEDAHQ